MQKQLDAQGYPAISWQALFGNVSISVQVLCTIFAMMGKVFFTNFGVGGQAISRMLLWLGVLSSGIPGLVDSCAGILLWVGGFLSGICASVGRCFSGLLPWAGRLSVRTLVSKDRCFAGIVFSVNTFCARTPESEGSLLNGSIFSAHVKSLRFFPVGFVLLVLERFRGLSLTSGSSTLLHFGNKVIVGSK